MGRKTTTVRWCSKCDIPDIDRKSCPVCRSQAIQIGILPADIRPAFPYDIDRCRRLLNDAYGCGETPFLDDYVVLLFGKETSPNGLSVVAHGRIAARIYQDMDGRETVHLTFDGAAMAAPSITRGHVRVKRGAVPYILTGKNVMATSVVGADRSISPGDEVMVMTTDGSLLAAGTARMPGDDMISGSQGMAVKVRDVNRDREPPKMLPFDWDGVIKANEEVLKRRVATSVRFLKEKVDGTDLPPVISFSGGKDSLTVLLLTIDAGYRMPVMYVDTGLEYDETIEYVRYITEHYGLDMILAQGSTELFFSNLVRFGPPAMDFRWCCKTNKLGPLARAQGEHFPNGCLSIIGRRMYESESRESHGDTWYNPWFPGSMGISPVQGWNSLHVWMYIFMRRAPFNILYTRGLPRIGCALCPSAGRVTEAVSGTAIIPRWRRYLEEYSRQYDNPEGWLKYDLWRWKKHPVPVRDRVVAEYGGMPEKITESDRLTMAVQPGFSPCVVGFSVECALSRPVDIRRLSVFSCILGENVDEDPTGTGSRWGC